MKNLRTHRGDYRYQTGDRGKIGRLEVEYDKGLYSGAPRGVYVTMRETTIEEAGVAGMICESFIVGGGRRGQKILAIRLKRDTPSKTLMVAELVDEIAPEAAALYMADQWEAAIAKVREALAVLHA